MVALAKKRLFLLDMDGTIYLDNNLFDGTLDFLKKVTERQGKYLFVTNNSSKGVETYLEKVKALGIPATKDNFWTSTDATILYIKKNLPEVRWYAMGTSSFVEQLRASGICVAETADDEVSGVLISNDQELNFAKLQDVCRLLTEKWNIPYLATNPDWVCPTAFGYVPDCGSFAEMLQRATGKTPIFIGKPQPDMLLVAMEKFGYRKEDCLMVGDRLYTDIASGFHAGIDTVFVLSGEGTIADLETSDVKPTYVMKNIRELCEQLDGAD